MRRYSVMAWGAAAVMTLAVSFSLLRIPIQTTDSLVVMLQAQAAPSAWIGNFMNETGFLRPFYWAQTRLLLDGAGSDHHFAVFRGFHAALVAGLFAMFVLAAGVRSRRDFAAFAFALLVVVGHHTFRGNVWEAYPVNHYLEVALLCLGALVLCQSRGGWWADLLAGLLFLVASLTLESGLIVWVVILTARATGMRGVSWKGVALVTLLLGGYFYLRFVHLGTGTPGIDERAMGFGLGRLERDEVISRFAEAPYVLYAYNVIASVLSVTLSEPRGGTWEMTRRWLAGEMTPSVSVALVSSVITTGLIGWFAASRYRLWRAARFEHDDGLVVVFLAVLGANAAMCFAYTKDEIMSTAGVFYALAAYAAARATLEHLARVPLRSQLAAAVIVALLAATSTAWAIRATGLHYYMYVAGYYAQNEWVTVDDWLREQHVELATEDDVRLVRTLRTAAIEMPTLHPYFLPRWAERWFH